MSVRVCAILSGVAVLALSGCAEGGMAELTGDTEILGIGDSLLSMNAPEDDITSVAAASLDLTAELAAVGGETMLGDEENSVPLQYEAGREGDSWLLIASGGGNDLAECACGVDCDGVLDALVSEDGTSGGIVDLVERAIDDGRSVAWIGYMRPTEAAVEFGDCDAELNTYIQRMTVLDDRLDALVFVDGTQIGNGEENELYVDDGYHPSEDGSAALGQALAERIASDLAR